jgi:hypothetical protein
MFPFDEFLSNYEEIHAGILGFSDGFSITFPQNFHECPDDICPKGEDRWYFKGFQVMGWLIKWTVYVLLIHAGVVNIGQIFPALGL